ncbi:unnamed protein product [Protopolystoma xenopodis]|uniref:Fibronectin type-III domain-containing protein n=1 Tax=Protopolystoma xenopodis TaxID=117903 RepID=A0A3S5B8F9_9PLAT|nr:unnamed protein product [Protopolystoma xenopodis]
MTNSVLISWRPPEPPLIDSQGEVHAYYIYVDGQFRCAVKACEKKRALLDNVDVDKPHRISVRSLTSYGQSKDAQCTLVVGKGATATPARLKATQLTASSAKLSWLPSNSNLPHIIYLNDYEIRVCPPGVYKLLLTGEQT